MKVRITPILAVFTLFIALNSKAQNLVVNPSFEVQSSCPYGMSMLNRATPWLPGRSTPDYLHTCPGTACCDLPSNYFGFEYAATGNGCGGGLFYGSFANYYLANFREFLFGSLSAALNPGQTYYVSFKVNLVDTASFACNNLGILFENTYSTAFGLTNTAHVFSSAIITTQSGWVTIQGTFVPTQAYTNFYVGNFFADSLTSTLNVGTTANDWMAYYYVDDFCVSPNSWECGTFLPVEWTAWNAEWQKDHVQLAWQLEGETVTSYQVEESWDGETFQTVATIDAAVQDEEEFEYHHLPSLHGREAMYRIRATDPQGTTYLSQIARVDIPGTPYEAFQISPNPARRGQQLSVRLPAAEGAIKLSWMDERGKEVHSQTFEGNALDRTVALESPPLQQGLYHVLAQSAHWKVHQKWVLLD